jgi:hypothetical protein
VARIHDARLQTIFFQNLVQRYPVDACRLHGNQW